MKFNKAVWLILWSLLPLGLILIYNSYDFAFKNITFVSADNVVLQVYNSFKSSRIMKSKGISRVIKSCSNEELTEQLKNVLSYSLYGEHQAWEKYGKSIPEVLKQVNGSKVYKNWVVRIYHENSYINASVAKSYSNIYQHVQFCNIKNSPYYGDLSRINGMVWRFLPITDTFVNVTCFRDLDSPIIKREEDAVSVWLNSTKIVHIMRDSQFHKFAVLGGTWCFRTKKNISTSFQILKLILSKASYRKLRNKTTDLKWEDQNILKKYVWPLIKNDSIQHDSYYCKLYPGSIPFPTQRNIDKAFVGCYKPCGKVYPPKECPIKCRPEKHKNWTYC